VGVPLARPLVVDHPDDPTTTWHLSDKWLLGDDLLLAPGAPPAGWQRVAHVDGETATITTTRHDPTVVVDGLPPTVEIRIGDGTGDSRRPPDPTHKRGLSRSEEPALRR